jgi:glycosyltransferase involved in cell wall biosynthesis
MKAVHLVRNIPEPKTGTGTRTGTGTGTGDRFRERFGIPQSDFVALYQGAFTYNRGLETALAAMEGLEAEGIHLVLMGYGPLQHLVDEAAARLPHVHVHPAVAYEEVLAHTQSADVGLVSVRPTCLSYLYCLPNKLFEYTLAGVPVLSNDLPDCAAFIHSYQIGEVVPHDTPEGWRHALRDLKSTGTARFKLGLERAGQDLSWQKEAQTLVGVYQDLGV